jgi:hypothetical protein
MGRDAAAGVTFAGRSEPGRAVLEGDVLILRGAIRARIARGDLRDWWADGDNLRLATPEGPLVLTLGAAEAAAWVRALDRSPPTLAAKLGLASPVRAIGVTDPALVAALAPHLGEPAAMAVAEVRSAAELAAALQVAEDLVLWVATVKGPASPFGEDAARAILRAAGRIDSKTCRVSDSLAATRYALVGRRGDGHMAVRQGDRP